MYVLVVVILYLFLLLEWLQVLTRPPWTLKSQLCDWDPRLNHNKKSPCSRAALWLVQGSASALGTLASRDESVREILKMSGGPKVLTCGDIFFNLLNSLAAALRAFSGSSAALEDILRQFVCLVLKNPDSFKYQQCLLQISWTSLQFLLFFSETWLLTKT